jgi:hypothetical protein
MLSETLRYELAPLNVRVITLVAGNVSSHMSSGVNGPPPAELPPTSRYKAIEKELQKNEEFADMDTTVFANEVVGAVVSGATGKVWKGGNMATVRWLMPFMPSFVYVSSRWCLASRVDNHTRTGSWYPWEEGLTKCQRVLDDPIQWQKAWRRGSFGHQHFQLLPSLCECTCQVI